MNTLNPKEVIIIQMALGTMIEDFEATMNDPRFNFTPEARKEQKEIYATAKSALAKIALVSGALVKIDPYNEGDEIEFLTKES